MGKGSAPKPPDPSKVQAAQTQTNIDTAIANNRMGMVDQVTPWGTVTYETIYDQPPVGAGPSAAPSYAKGSTFNGGTVLRQDGNRVLTNKNGVIDWVDLPQQAAGASGGAGMNVPRYRAVTTLDGTAKNINDLATSISGRLGDTLGMPLDLSSGATEARLMELGRARLDPALERRRETLRTTLSNQGIKEGSEAFDRAMARAMEGENDAYNQLMLTGRGQAVQEALLERSTPLNELMALLNGSQVGVPQASAQPSQMPTVDRAGLEMANYQSRVNNYNQRQQGFQNIMGGLFGLGSGALMGGYF